MNTLLEIFCDVDDFVRRLCRNEKSMIHVAGKALVSLPISWRLSLAPMALWRWKILGKDLRVDG